MRKILSAAAVSLLLTGCHSMSMRTETSTAFDPREAAFVRLPGSTVITGTAFKTGPNGQPVYASGEVVRLIPVTAYSRDRFDKLYLGKSFAPLSAAARVPQADPQYVQYTRTVKADATGNYKFDNVGAGSYFVTTQVTWPYQGTKERVGGSIYNVVTVHGDEQAPLHLDLVGDD